MSPSICPKPLPELTSRTPVSVWFLLEPWLTHNPHLFIPSYFLCLCIFGFYCLRYLSVLTSSVYRQRHTQIHTCLTLFKMKQKHFRFETAFRKTAFWPLLFDIFCHPTLIILPWRSCQFLESFPCVAKGSGYCHVLLSHCTWHTAVILLMFVVRMLPGFCESILEIWRGIHWPAKSDLCVFMAVRRAFLSGNSYALINALMYWSVGANLSYVNLFLLIKNLLHKNIHVTVQNSRP